MSKMGEQNKNSQVRKELEARIIENRYHGWNICECANKGCVIAANKEIFYSKCVNDGRCEPDEFNVILTNLANKNPQEYGNLTTKISNFLLNI